MSKRSLYRQWSLTRLACCLMLAVTVVCAELPRPVAAAEVLVSEQFRRILVFAYTHNLSLQGERANLRAVEETVKQAQGGYRPQVSASLYGGLQSVRDTLRPAGTQRYDLQPGGANLTVTQPLYDGGRTPNAVGQARSQVNAQNETVRLAELQMILDAVSAYMSVMTAQSVVEAQNKNMAVLREALNNAQVRYRAGAITPSDVAQAESRLSRGTADLSAARTDLEIQISQYRRVVGEGPPARMGAVPIPGRLLPRDTEAAYAIGFEESPSVRAAKHNVQAAEAAVRVAQAALLPSANLVGQVRHDANPDIDRYNTSQAQVIGTLTVPLYSGGIPESQVRQAREQLSAARIQLDSARLATRTAIKNAAAAFAASATLVKATSDELHAAEEAFRGIKVQAEAGTRTITDMLNAQQDVITARVRNLQAQRDRVIAAYSVVAAIGRLSLSQLGIARPSLAQAPKPSEVETRLDAWRDLRHPTGPTPATEPHPETGR